MPTGTHERSNFRIVPLRPLAELREEALALSPPTEAGSFRPSQLVNLGTLAENLQFELRYATTDNFLGARFYEAAVPLLQAPAAQALRAAAADFRARGLGLVVYDAYRPWYITKMFWEATPPELRQFVADPTLGSRHNRGCAVDLSLYDLETGDVLEMPSGYDEFTERAHVDFAGGPAEARANRDLLRDVMETHQFTVYPPEWWHFDYDAWRAFPILNAPLT